MPSPFPGMDPYLEHPALFRGLHGRLVANLSETLQSRLPAPYFAEFEERLWVEVSERPIEPDVSVFRAERPPGVRTDGGPVVGVATRSRPLVVTVPFEENRETWVEIRTRNDDGERLVTSIEVLSLTNKTTGRRARDLYLQKQREILDSQVHLVEIDLLRGGTHSTAVPRHRLLAAAGAFDYHVAIHPFDRLEDFLVYPIRLEERLPEIAIPLLPGDPDVPIDLQAVFDRCYDTGPYLRRVRYAEVTPVPPLRPDQAEWAARVLQPPGEPRP